MRIVLVGEEAAGNQVLRALAQRGHDIVAVMAQPDSSSATGASLWDIARTQGHETWPADEVRHPSLADKLSERGVDVVLNVHSLHVVHAACLEVPRHGWYNLHPGPLPEYAGLNTVGWAISRGEPTYGVTIHRMSPRIDAGAICYQARFPIEDDDTALRLSARCVRIGVPLVLKLVEALRHDPASVPRIEQDATARRVYQRDEIPGGGVFSWAQPASTVVDFIRAFDFYPLPSPWGYPRATLGGPEFGIVGAARTSRRASVSPGTIEPGPQKAILVACRDEWVSIRRVAQAGHLHDADSILSRSIPSSPQEQA